MKSTSASRRSIAGVRRRIREQCRQVLAREVSAHCAGSKHALHCHNMGLDALRARYREWRKCESTREREEKGEPEEEEETDSGPWVHLSARESTMHWSTASELGIYTFSKFVVTVTVEPQH